MKLLLKLSAFVFVIFSFACSPKLTPPPAVEIDEAIKEEKKIWLTDLSSTPVIKTPENGRITPFDLASESEDLGWMYLEFDSLGYLFYESSSPNTVSLQLAKKMCADLWDAETYERTDTDFSRTLLCECSIPVFNIEVFAEYSGMFYGLHSREIRVTWTKTGEEIRSIKQIGKTTNQVERINYNCKYKQ